MQQLESSRKQEQSVHLQLAQRHRKVVAGCFKGRTAFEPEFTTPGVVGKLTLSFTPSGQLGKYSRITCQLPDHGWLLPTTPPPNVVLRLPSLNEMELTGALPQVKMTWNSMTRIMEFTLFNEIEILGGTLVVFVVSGVGTPEKATPQGEGIMTILERLVTRKTVPLSTRGGQIIDGPSVFTIPKIIPGTIGGTRRWSPLNCCPGAVSDVTLAFTVSGTVPCGGRLLVELPPHGWSMDKQPKVWLRTSSYSDKSLVASWDCMQHTLEIVLEHETSIATKTNVVLAIEKVTNPKTEINLLASDASIATARLTTMSASGGVIDGPTKVEVARISELRECDFQVFSKVLDADRAETSPTNGEGVGVDRVADLLRRAGLMLSDELYETLVVPCFPVRTVLPSTNDKDGEAVHAPTLQIQRLSREELLNMFALVYAPAYKYGQELRLACGRGHLELVQKLISRGCNPNASDASGWSALHYASDYGRFDVLKLLVEMAPLQPKIDQIDPIILEINARDGHGWTPLMCAAANGHIDVMQRLLLLGADVSLTSSEDRSALHWAASRGMTAAVSVLLTAGADINQADRCGWTPLHCAMVHDHSDCAARLIDEGANLLIRDNLDYVAQFYSNFKDA